MEWWTCGIRKTRKGLHKLQATQPALQAWPSIMTAQNWQLQHHTHLKRVTLTIQRTKCMWGLCKRVRFAPNHVNEMGSFCILENCCLFVTWDDGKLLESKSKIIEVKYWVSDNCKSKWIDKCRSNVTINKDGEDSEVWQAWLVKLQYTVP